jgi:hypothetical protein
MATFSEKINMTYKSLELSQGQDVQKLKVKGLKKEKMQRTIVESLHFSTMAASYNTHFATYSNVKK